MLLRQIIDLITFEVNTQPYVIERKSYKTGYVTMEDMLPLKIIDKPFDQNIDSSAEPDETFKSEENDNVAHILNQVSQLSELDKYMLYLQLPTEETTEDGTEDSSKVHVTLMAKRTDAAIKWIRQNYTDTHDQSVFLPKEEVYEHYREQCELEENKLLNSADFGKVMKLVFPKIAHRRLGLKQKSGNTSSTCNACNRDLTEKPSPDVNLYALSCQIVCEWASQLLERQLTDIKSLSEYLVSKGFSYGKAAAKFSLLSGSTGHHKQLEKDRKSPRFQDGQVLLQRKLLQKEIIRQHKKKLQEQQRFQRELAKSSPLISTHPSADGRRTRRVQQRPSSVQSYIPSWSSSQTTYSNGLLTSGQVSLNEVQSNAAQSSSRLMGLLVSNNKDCIDSNERGVRVPV
ncbi:hypothetical protein Btru_041397 [Bulinus truncatus]|nr:hypothetical protein Btru_041397 [Bulinus truncatus]